MGLSSRVLNSARLEGVVVAQTLDKVVVGIGKLRIVAQNNVGDLAIGDRVVVIRDGGRGIVVGRIKTPESKEYELPKRYFGGCCSRYPPDMTPNNYDGDPRYVGPCASTGPELCCLGEDCLYNYSGPVSAFKGVSGECHDCSYWAKITSVDAPIKWSARLPGDNCTSYYDEMFANIAFDVTFRCGSFTDHHPDISIRFQYGSEDSFPRYGMNVNDYCMSSGGGTVTITGGPPKPWPNCRPLAISLWYRYDSWIIIDSVTVRNFPACEPYEDYCE